MKIDKFDGEYRWLSNFYHSPFRSGTNVWPTVEHYYQAYKATNPDDFYMIKNAPTAGKAKRLGAKIELNKDWEETKYYFMVHGVYLKFEQNEDLRNKLLATQGIELIEGNNWHDNYWGNCTCEQCKDIEGQNILGKILMEIRNYCDMFLNL